ncbi:CBS domain-containing protein [Undibacterium sp.]|uniref:CBS domain-containing protein n=1 Tax=Undibacterium sp. TaxID=1914977 RepID=UPI0025DFD292|nr:CBS domain-containing protein [Undibacterium sp.]
MFSVYGVTGRVYSGSYEGISRVNPVRRAQQGRSVEQDGAELGADIIPSQFSARVLPPTTAEQSAINAYRSSLPSEFERGPLFHARQIMQTKVISVNVDDTVAAAWKLMRESGIHQAPVFNSAAKLIGVVSERDLLTSLNLSQDVPTQVLERRVSDVMRSPVVASAPLTDIRRIARVMLEYEIDGVPILDESERLVGFISRSDMLRVLMKDPPLSLWC